MSHQNFWACGYNAVGERLYTQHVKGPFQAAQLLKADALQTPGVVSFGILSFNPERTKDILLLYAMEDDDALAC